MMTVVSSSARQPRWIRQRISHRKKFPLLLLVVMLLMLLHLFSPSSQGIHQMEHPGYSQPNKLRNKHINHNTKNALGAIVFLAPQRNEGSMWGIDRFCMLLRAIRSVDQFLNTRFGPYPIYVLVAKDHALDPRQKDAMYTEKDRRMIRSWAPDSTIHFQEINMYSQDALEPNTTREQILQWRKGDDGGIEGRDLGYTSMCRLWSGRLQNMEFLNRYKYYLRMDDDSLLTAEFPFDPFQKLESHNLTYAYRREAFDHWGVEHLWRVSKPYLGISSSLPFLSFDGGYDGMQPYNNFHVSLVCFWRSPKWMQLWKEYNTNHLFYKYRVGDANVHAIAIMTMGEGTYETWQDIPYAHNTNDWDSAEENWGTKAWVEECKEAFNKIKY